MGPLGENGNHRKPPRTPEEAEQVLKELVRQFDPAQAVPIPGVAGVTVVLPARRDKLTAELYELIVEQILAITFITSFEEGHQQVYVSPQIERILGYTPKEWLANPSLWYERLHPEEKERWNKEFAATVVSRGTAVRAVYRFLHRSGRTVWILGDVRIKRDSIGQPVFVQAVGFDVTEMEEAKARQLAAQQERIARLQSEVAREFGPDQLVGSSKAMQELRALIAKVARSDASAVITGESGTGKELVARALHYSGPRKDKPFVAVNCGAFPDASLLDDALFGHEKGAYTGATERVAGRLEEADGGTLFLDEIGNMPGLVQDRILRFIQERTLRPLGAKKDLRVDVRIIAATHKDLQALIQEGVFKKDLYYKLNVLSLAVPPLRERPGDVPELAALFLARANRDEKREARLSEAAMALMKSHPWRENNVRELENAVKSAVVMCEGETILPEHLPAALAGRRPEPAPAAATASRQKYYDAVEKLERSMIVAALGEAKGVKAEAARALTLSVNTLTNRMTALGIRALEAAPWVAEV